MMRDMAIYQRILLLVQLPGCFLFDQNAMYMSFVSWERGREREEREREMFYCYVHKLSYQNTTLTHNLKD